MNIPAQDGAPDPAIDRMNEGHNVTDPAIDGDTALSPSEVADLFDFSAQDDEPAQDAATQKPEAETGEDGNADVTPATEGGAEVPADGGEGKDPAQPAKKEDPAANTEGTPQQKQVDVQALQAQALAAAMQQLQARNAAPQQQQDNDPTKSPDFFNFGIPPKVAEALDSEDPAERTNAIASLMSATAHHTFKRVTEYMQQQVLPQYQQSFVSQQQQQQEAGRIKEDFYGTYPQLNQPALFPVVTSVYQQIAQETGQTQWTPELRDMIAQRVGQLLGKAVPAQVQNPVTVQPKPAAPYVAGKGARPTVQPQRTRSQEDMMLELLD